MVGLLFCFCCWLPSIWSLPLFQTSSYLSVSCFSFSSISHHIVCFFFLIYYLALCFPLFPLVLLLLVSCIYFLLFRTYLPHRQLPVLYFNHNIKQCGCPNIPLPNSYLCLFLLLYLLDFVFLHLLYLLSFYLVLQMCVEFLIYTFPLVLYLCKWSQKLVHNV